MADEKLTALTALDAFATGDLLYTVDDPAGTPLSKKATIDQAKTFIVGAGSVSIASGKTLTGSNTLTLAGTDATTMTFPATSATLARTDAGNTFTGNQTLGSSDNLNWNSDTILTRRGAANLRLGAADTTGATAPTPQFLSAQSWASSTTNNQTGANFTIDGSQGTGTGAGGSIIFRVAPAGGVANGVQNALATALTIGSDRSAFFDGPSNNRLTVRGSGNTGQIFIPSQFAVGFNVGAVGCFIREDGLFGWQSSPGSGAPNPSIARDAANTIGLRNGTNAQTFNIYNTYTSATSFERFRIFAQSAASVLIGTEKGSGGGTARALELQTDATSRLALDTVGSAQIVTALTVATLPGTPLVGMIARVTDALAPAVGVTVAAGGAAQALCWYNGANWTVIGV
jgi:hypothetical protein